MGRKIFVWVFIFLSIIVKAQNLVPNPSFESNTGCPDSTGCIELLNDWWSPWGRPVYFHACNNYQTQYRRIVPPEQKPYNVNPVIAFSGEGYAGIYMSVITAPKHHDYLMCKLNSPLMKDSVYRVEMMVRLGNVWKFVDYIGMHFSHDKYKPSRKQVFSFYSHYNDTNSRRVVNRVSLNFDKDTIRLSNDNAKLNDRHNWIRIIGEYLAKGGEQYITIGNFYIGNNGLFNNNVKPDEITFEKDGHALLEGEFDFSSYKNSFYYIDNVYVGKLPVKESRAYLKFSSIIKEGEKLKLENIYFDTGQRTVKRESHASLQLLLTYMEENTSLHLSVEGHTDSVGSAENNLVLSKQRAESIINFLQLNGIDSVRMKSIGYGSSKPVANNLTHEGRELNRRVEFTLTKR